MIGVVINADTRRGFLSDNTRIGEFAEGSLEGCRSADYLTDGVVNKWNFFAGHDVNIWLHIDEHEPLPDAVRSQLEELKARGILRGYVLKPHDRRRDRWYDHIYLEALRNAQGDYVVHCDADVAMFRHPQVDPVADFKTYLDRGVAKFVCQPSAVEDHGMWWASTRFFMAKPQDWDEVERCLSNDYLVKRYNWRGERHFPCLEHTLGGMAGVGKVLYPHADWSRYMVFSWVTYHAGLLRALNAAPYEAVKHHILETCGGIHGPNDVLGKPMLTG